MKKYILIAFGGFFGAILRILIEDLDIEKFYIGIIPIKTLFINVTGSFLLAAVSIYFVEKMTRHLNINLMICTGFFGAYTTFSTVCREFWIISNQHYYIQAVFYICVSIVLGLCSSFAGIHTTRFIMNKNHKEVIK